MRRVVSGIGGVVLGLAGAVALGAEPGAGAPPDFPHVHEDDHPFGLALLDRFEYRDADGQNQWSWDAQAWYGGDYQRLWLKTEGEHPVSDSNGEVELQALYSRLIAPYWDLQAGVRYDRAYGSGPDRDRAFGVLGVQGLAPYRFETDLALFVSEDGDASARAEIETDLLLTQRLILQPRLELDVAFAEVPEWGVGRGPNDVAVGLRLRYEIRRELAPYAGVEWVRRLGDTAELAREEGGDRSDIAWVIGVRAWF